MRSEFASFSIAIERNELTYRGGAGTPSERCMGPLSRVVHTRDEAPLGGRTCGFDLTCRPQLDESLVKVRQFIDHGPHRYKSSGPVLHCRAERTETDVTVQLQAFFH